MQNTRTNPEQNQYQREAGIYDERIGTVYKASGGLFVAVKCAKTTPRRYQGCVRGRIASFSPRSGCRMRAYLRGCLADYGTMVTLTYPGYFPSNGKAVKEHLRRFLQEMRRLYEKKRPPSEFSAFWFLEFQARGAPHFHIFTNGQPCKEWVASTWYRVVDSEDIRHYHAGTRVEQIRAGRAGTISYASKYAAKLEQKTVPAGYENVGRFWGVFGRRSVLSADTFVSTAAVLENTTVQRVLTKLRDNISQLVWKGYAEVLKRENGLLVIKLITPEAQRTIRGRIAELTAATMVFSDMFDDAELDD